MKVDRRGWPGTRVALTANGGAHAGVERIFTINFMARGATPGDENAGHGMPCPYNCRLPTAHYFHDKGL